jgi:glycosyltransferase involved in cell wall biosynthesis
MKRLAIVTTHPIQYNAPLFRLLSQRGKLLVKVFYTWSQSAEGNIYDPGFGINKNWDIPLLEGYDFHFSSNISGNPGSHHFRGVINPTLVKDISGFNPDAVLVYGWNFYSHLKVMRFFKGKIPVFFRGDSNLIDDAGKSLLKKKMRYAFLQWVYKHTDFAFYAGQLNKSYFLKTGLKEAQLIFLPHAIDNARFENFDKLQMQAIKAQLNIPEQAVVLLFAGKFEEKKDPEFLVTCFSQYNDPDIHLVLVGNGVMEDHLKSTYSDIKNLHFLPFQNQTQMPAIYGMADVFILPSKGPGETWGLAVNEAMAAGKAVLVSNKCGCHIDLIRDGENGYVFKSGDRLDFLHQLHQLIVRGKDGLERCGSVSRSIIGDWSFLDCAMQIERSMNKE